MLSATNMSFFSNKINEKPLVIMELANNHMGDVDHGLKMIDEFSKVTKSEVINYSAAGFRDFTRLAASDPIMWRDIFINNKDAALEILGRFTEELFALQSAIRRKDSKFLQEYFERTRKVRRSIIEAGQDTPKENFGREGR